MNIINRDNNFGVYNNINISQNTINTDNTTSVEKSKKKIEIKKRFKDLKDKLKSKKSSFKFKKKNKKNKQDKESFENKINNENSENKENIEKKPNIFMRILKFIGKVIWFIIRFIFGTVNFILKSFYAMLNTLLIIGVVGLCVGLIIFAKVYPLYQESSQEAYEKLAAIKESDFQMDEDTKVFDADGNIIGQINAGDYKYIEIGNVSDYVQKGYIALEDKHFMQHIGIDAQSILRASIALLRHNGEITQGGSTITQQVIKNCVLTSEQTFKRKIVEILLAPRVEQMYPKPKIMEFYVNTCFYGNNCYGIETASQFYFGKPCSDLTLAEAAMLCGISNAPSKYNPVASFELATERKEKVLKDMLKEKYITKKEYNEAMDEEIELSLVSHNYKTENYMTSYAIYCATLKLMEKDGFQFRYTFDDSQDEEYYTSRYKDEYTKKSAMIRSGGYKIYTSFKQDIQDKLQATIDDSLKKYKETQENGKYAMQGASVCIDNETGFVIAMVGGRGSEDEFNRAFLSTRQPGSSIKPLLVYAPAIDKGVITPSSVYTDQPVYSKDGKYSPRNYGGSYRGNMTIRESVARSINTIAYQVYTETGKAKSISYLDKMKFSSLSYADNYTEALCLGGFTNGVRIVEEAKGYATLAMGGKYTNVDCITKFDSNKEGVIFDYKAKDYNLTTEIFTEDTAFMMTDTLEGVVEEPYGTAAAIKDQNILIAGKTGTTNSNKDVWFSGYTKNYTATFWMGYDTPRSMAGVGSSVTARMFSDFIHKIENPEEPQDFSKPETVSLRYYSHNTYTGDDLPIEYGEGDIWYRVRDFGTEWYGLKNKEALETIADEKIEEKNIELAKEALIEFEKFYVNSIEDALALDDKYSELLSLINNVGDAYSYSDLLKRAVKHYDLLSGDIVKSWNKAKEEFYKNEEDQRYEEDVLKADDSATAAYNELKKVRFDKADWFLDKVYSRKYNTEASQLLLDDTRLVIERLAEYEEYVNYIQKLSDAEAYLANLPTQIPVIQLPEDVIDTTDPNASAYYDATDIIEKLNIMTKTYNEYIDSNQKVINSNQKTIDAYNNYTQTLQQAIQHQVDQSIINQNTVVTQQNALNQQQQNTNTNSSASDVYITN